VAESGEVLLEGRHRGPEDELRVVEDALYRLIDLGLERAVLCFQVDEGDHRFFSVLGATF
jgi:hypothetical protein